MHWLPPPLPPGRGWLADESGRAIRLLQFGAVLALIPSDAPAQQCRWETQSARYIPDTQQIRSRTDLAPESATAASARRVHQSLGWPNHRGSILGSRRLTG